MIRMQAARHMEDNGDHRAHKNCNDSKNRERLPNAGSKAAASRRFRQVDASRSKKKRKLRLLVSEDTRATREFLAAALDPSQFEIEFAFHGAEALQKCEQSQYDVLLTDVQMPVMDGLTMIRKIRELEEMDEIRYRIPIVALTAGAASVSRRTCLDAGADDYLTKPIDLPKLVSTLQQVTGIDECEIDHSGSNWIHNNESEKKPEYPETQHRAAFDKQSALRRLQGNEALFQKLAEFFLADFQELLGKLAEGVTKAEFEAVTRHAHTLKGIASSLEATLVVNLAKELRQMADAGEPTGMNNVFTRLEAAVSTLALELQTLLDESKRN